MFLFRDDDGFAIGAGVGEYLMTGIGQRILALTVQIWHVHFLIADSECLIADVVKCEKDAVRDHLRAGWIQDL